MADANKTPIGTWLHSPAPDRTPVCLQIVHDPDCATRKPAVSFMPLNSNVALQLRVQSYEQVTQQQAAHCCRRPPMHLQGIRARLKISSRREAGQHAMVRCAEGPHNPRCWALITPAKKTAGAVKVPMPWHRSEATATRKPAAPGLLPQKSHPDPFLDGFMMLDSACAGAAPARTTCDSKSSSAFFSLRLPDNSVRLGLQQAGERMRRRGERVRRRGAAAHHERQQVQQRPCRVALRHRVRDFQSLQDHGKRTTEHQNRLGPSKVPHQPVALCAGCANFAVNTAERHHSNWQCTRKLSVLLH